ncbi:hypothetical protein [Christiangramia aestuarii]|nr:hypothetical protein [Christiangramia aestuarii]
MKKFCWIGLVISMVASFFSCEPEPCTKTIDTYNGPMTVEFDCNPNSF